MGPVLAVSWHDLDKFSGLSGGAAVDPRGVRAPNSCGGNMQVCDQKETQGMLDFLSG